MNRFTFMFPTALMQGLLKRRRPPSRKWMRFVSIRGVFVNLTINLCERLRKAWRKAGLRPLQAKSPDINRLTCHQKRTDSFAM